MQKQITAKWTDHGTVSDVRPTGYRLRSDGFFPITSVAPVLTPADPDWKSKVGSLQWQCSAELFNKHVGWTVAYWHWSVVEGGKLLGAGDEPTVEAAKAKVEATLPLRIRRHMTVQA